MTIKPTELKDLPTIMAIISDAQRYLKELGIDQWQDGYPNKEQIILDIENNDSYVVLSDNELIGTVVFSTKSESTYNQIEGDWITDKMANYGVIHRLAVANKNRGQGMSRFLFDSFEQRLEEMNFDSMRIDTHRDNKGMQQLITSLGYEYCGVIKLVSGAERLAFEKVLNPKA